ncbi:hypothetical protein B566_EDAN007607 [Ephemera danica]|nr:hypothetical protein B566_EDAN007607 [Ephemera danica]
MMNTRLLTSLASLTLFAVAASLTYLLDDALVGSTITGTEMRHSSSSSCNINSLKNQMNSIRSVSSRGLRKRRYPRQSPEGPVLTFVLETITSVLAFFLSLVSIVLWRLDLASWELYDCVAYGFAIASQAISEGKNINKLTPSNNVDEGRISVVDLHSLSIRRNSKYSKIEFQFVIKYSKGVSINTADGQRDVYGTVVTIAADNLASNALVVGTHYDSDINSFAHIWPVIDDTNGIGVARRNPGCTS